MPRPDRAVDHGLRLADQGACVPWDALAAIERAQADAAARRAIADSGEDGGATPAESTGQVGRRRAIGAWVRTWTGRSR